MLLPFLQSALARIHVRHGLGKPDQTQNIRLPVSAASIFAWPHLITTLTGHGAEQRPVRGRSPALPPSSPPPYAEHDISIDDQISPPRKLPLEDHLLSPEIARLPPPRTPISVRSRPRDVSSEYYTAVWGSPYEVSPSSRSARTAVSEQVPSEDLLESSPTPDFGLEQLIPSRLGELSLLSADPSAAEPTAADIDDREDHELTPRSRTKRWIQLPQRKDESEKSRWWSDESGHSTSDRELKKTRKGQASGPSRRVKKLARGHKTRESNLTINQQSFWKDLREQNEDMSSLYSSRWAATPPAEESEVKETESEVKQPESGMHTSRWAELSPPPEPAQLELASTLMKSRWADTPSPVEPERKVDDGEERLQENTEEQAIESTTEKKTDGEPAVDDSSGVVPESTAEVPAKGDESEKPVEPEPEKSLPEVMLDDVAKHILIPAEDREIVPTSPSKSRLVSPRVKKIVMFGDRKIVISIPNLDFEALGIAEPWDFADIQARVKQFEDAGYDTRGFDILAEDDVNDEPAHAKAIYPDEAEFSATEIYKDAKVILPDLKKWSAYMDWLTEQKLAALGVSLGGEEPTPAQSQDLSRQSSGQYPALPYSPPIPSASANSVGRPGLMRGHTHTMSVASPISPLNGPFGHMHRHSTFTGIPNFMQTQQPGQQQGLIGLQSFSPQSQHGPPSIPSIQSMSPAIPGFNRAGSPAQLGAFRNDLAALRSPASPLSQQMFPQSPQDYSRMLAEDQMRRQQVYPQQTQMPRMPNNFTFNSSSMQPTPALPELPEEDDEEELLEKSEPESEPPAEADEDEPESEVPAYVPPQKRAQLNANIAVPTPRGHRHNISEGFERDILEAEKRHEADRQNWIVVEEESSTQSSNSEAKSQRPKPQSNAERDPLSQDYEVQETAHTHKKSGSRFNVAAQPFKFNPGATFQPASTTAFTFGASAAKPNGQAPPGHSRQQSSGAFNVAAPVFKPSGMPSLQDFSFSSGGPAFKPDVPSFGQNNQHQRQTSTVGEANGIFGKVDIPDIEKPARRSKAIPIVHPDDEAAKSSNSGTEHEDEMGRLAQSEDRLKRQRKGGASGEEIPRFAEPTPMPAPSDFILPSQKDVPPMEDVDEPREDSKAEISDEANDKSTKVTETVDDAFDVAFDRTYGDSTKPTEIDTRASYHKHKLSSSLSAQAMPFHPSGSFDMKKQFEHQPKQSVASISELEEGEIKEDERPATSPLRSEEPSAALDSEQRDFALADSEVVSQPSEKPIRADNGESVDLSFDEIEAVMQRLNNQGEEPDKASADISPLPSPGAHAMEGVTYLPEWTRSDAPSPSPKRQAPQFKPQLDSSFTIPDRSDSAERAVDAWPQVNRLNKAEEVPTSDWSGVFSAPDEEKLHQRGNFFDSHIDELVGKVLESRLQPLEETLRHIQSAVSQRPTSRDLTKKRSSSTVESDADDEDELSAAERQRPISRGKEKRADQIKAAVLEALREQGPMHLPRDSQDFRDLHTVLADMKVSFARAASSGLELEDIRAIVDDAVGKQSQSLVPIAMDQSERNSTHKRDMSELEGRLNETLAGALEEANQRRAAEEREADSRRMLRLAEEELQLLRESARDSDSRIHAVRQEREELTYNLEKAEETEREMKDRIKGLEEENAETYATIEEYRLSGNKWRHDIDHSTRKREELENQVSDLEDQLRQSREDCSKWRQESEESTREREELETTISGLERQLEESHEAGSSMRRRLEKLHSDMATAAGQLVSEKALWTSKEDDHRAKRESLESQITAHLQGRSQLEEELRTLRASATDATETKSVLDQLNLSNSSLQEMVLKLQADLAEQQSLAARHERDFHDAREAGRAEVQRTRMAMETDIETANHQVNIVRAELEAELSKVRLELENSRMEAETTKNRHDRLLEEEDTDRRETLRRVNHANNVALDETRSKHEASIQDLQAAHKRALDHAIEDKQRSESFLNERLSLSDAKMQHFQDRVLHLEERLEITKSAAQAAAISAQSRAAPAVTSATSALPEKVSPQALRESILVLQEQLQERESRIEKLQNQVDNEGPAKMKSRDDEIAWLRELLSVRSEELTDLVNTLAKPTYDRNHVRDAAIRIRASLEMEQQEKERVAQSASFDPGQAIASISNFATPKISSAFQKWRENMESSALRNAPRYNSRARSNTPSKAPPSNNAQPAYLSGLMTPPATNLRATPSPETAASLPAPRLHSRPGSKSDHAPMTEPPKLRSRQPSAASDAPTTPLFRSQSYDQDAQEDNKVHMEAFDETFEDDDLDIADTQPPAFRSLEDELEESVDDEVEA